VTGRPKFLPKETAAMKARRKNPATTIGDAVCAEERVATTRPVGPWSTA
jgi:hypothetical protein